MWRNSFFNFCFIMLVLSFLAFRHPIAIVHGSAASADDWDHEYPRSLAPAELGRAAAFLKDRWHRAMLMTEWLMEYNASQWEVFKGSDPAETDLLEAKFHITNAEVFTEALSETDRAVKELARAERSLEAVQPMVEPKLVLQLKTLENEITAAETSELGSGFANVPFETLKANLDRLMQSLRASSSGEA
jgi:hypothetical protein